MIMSAIYNARSNSHSRKFKNDDFVWKINILIDSQSNKAIYLFYTIHFKICRVKFTLRRYYPCLKDSDYSLCL